MSSSPSPGMSVDINKVIQKYRDALAEAQQNVILLSAQVEQLQEEMERTKAALPRD